MTIKIAILVDKESVPVEIYSLVKWAQEQDSLEMSGLIIQDVPGGVTTPGKITDRAADLFSRSLLAVISAIERRRLQNKYAPKHCLKNESGRTHVELGEMECLFSNPIGINPFFCESSRSHQYSSQDVENIRSQGFDLVLYFGSANIGMDLISVPRLGVITLCCPDGVGLFESVAGFREVYKKISRTGFIIRRISDEFGGGDVLCRGYFPTSSYWKSNLENLVVRSFHYLKKLLLDVVETDVLHVTEPRMPCSGRRRCVPTVVEQLAYASNLVLQAGLRVFRQKILQQQDCWGVAFARSDWNRLVMSRANIIRNPPGRFLADPFVISKNGKDYCFVEDFHCASGQAAISVYELIGEQAVFIGEALREPFHLSFPYLFEFESSVYMVPETSGKNEIRIYEAIDFPLGWKLKTVAMKDVSAADTMIFMCHGSWWLFTNIDPLGGGDHHSSLSIFRAESPVGDQWIPHRGNPVILDPLSARNGGILFDGDSVYRVSQKFGINRYGAGAQIRRIDRLDDGDFEETLVCEVEPDFFDALLGTHHLHSNGRVTVFDFLRREKK